MMSQNRSSAVMQQRTEAHDSLDDFPTPPWATRALCEWIKVRCAPGPFAKVKEPAANRGYMARPLGEYFSDVSASDVHDYGAGFEVRDYLFGPTPAQTNWVITNPPFRLAVEFVERALSHADCVAIFVRSSFLEGVDRYERLFRDMRPSDQHIFTERVVLWKGVLLDPDIPVWRPNPKTGKYELKKPSSATSYSWLVWRSGHVGRCRTHWIPPCRKALTRPGDYPPLPEHLRPPCSALELFKGGPI